MNNSGAFTATAKSKATALYELGSGSYYMVLLKIFLNISNKITILNGGMEIMFLMLISAQFVANSDGSDQHHRGV